MQPLADSANVSHIDIAYSYFKLVFLVKSAKIGVNRMNFCTAPGVLKAEWQSELHFRAQAGTTV